MSGVTKLGARVGTIVLLLAGLLATAIPSAQLAVYPGTGDPVLWEQPERVAADVVRFVEGLKLGR